ncbi:MAG TPA: hypothetical protein VLJ37_11765 [bacterium]|nr:hypothetical protein [bacterium]
MRLSVLVSVFLSLVLEAQAGPPAVQTGVPAAEGPQVLLPPAPRCSLEMAYKGQMVCRWNNLEIESVQNRLLFKYPYKAYDYSLAIKAKDRELTLYYGSVSYSGSLDCEKGCLQPVTTISDCANMAVAAQQGNIFFSVYVVFYQPIDLKNGKAQNMFDQLMNKNQATVFLDNIDVHEVGCLVNRSAQILPAPLYQPPQNEVDSFPPPPLEPTDAPSRWTPGWSSGYSPSPGVTKYCQGLKQGCLASAGTEKEIQQDCYSDYQACISESNCDVKRIVCLEDGQLTDDTCEANYKACQAKF